MPKLTAKQITQLADNLVTMASLISNYIIRYDLSVKGKLGKLHAAILGEASKLYHLSALEIGKEVHTSLEELNDLTGEAQGAYEKLNNLKLMIKLATAVLDISTAMAMGDLKGFVQSVKSLKLQMYSEEE